MENNPNMKEKRQPTITNDQLSMESFPEKIFSNLMLQAPTTGGMESNIENLKLSSRENCKYLAAEKQIPSLLTPGIIDNNWAIPIINPSFIVIFLLFSGF